MVSGKEGRSFLSSPDCPYSKAKDMLRGISQQVQGLGEGCVALGLSRFV